MDARMSARPRDPRQERMSRLTLLGGDAEGHPRSPLERPRCGRVTGHPSAIDSDPSPGGLTKPQGGLAFPTTVSERAPRATEAPNPDRDRHVMSLGTPSTWYELQARGRCPTTADEARSRLTEFPSQATLPA